MQDVNDEDNPYKSPEFLDESPLRTKDKVRRRWWPTSLPELSIPLGINAAF